MTPTTGPARPATPRLRVPATSSTTSESVTTFNPIARATAPQTALSPAASATNAATATTAAAAVTAAPGAGPGGGQQLQQQQSRRVPRPGGSDPLSDKATAFLIRKTLCSQHLGDKGKGRSTPAPIEELLPPLTSRNDVDLQLYALIAIVIKEFVQTWYSKITPDESFVAEVVRIIAHCTRALEQRMRKLDLESLLFDELPELIDKHVNAHRAAQNTLVRPPIQVDPREVYHSMCPLPALRPVPNLDIPSSVGEQAENEAAYRQLLVQAVLAVLLPTEDLENDCLTSLVGQIFSELIIGNVVANKLSEPWLIWEGVTILAGAIQKKTAHASGRDGWPNSTGGNVNGSAPRKRGFSLQRLFWSILQWGFLASTFVRFLVTVVVTSWSQPSRRQPLSGQTRKAARHMVDTESQEPSQDLNASAEPRKVPVLTFKIWPAVSNLIELDVRMPWLSGALSMAQWIAVTGPGRVAAVDGLVDRVLSNSIYRYLLDPSHIPPLLRTLRGVLFPNNAQGTPTLFPPSSDAELQALRRKCANALWTLVPEIVGRHYFGYGFWRRASPVIVTEAPAPSAHGSSSSLRTGPQNWQEEDQQKRVMAQTSADREEQRQEPAQHGKEQQAPVPSPGSRTNPTSGTSADLTPPPPLQDSSGKGSFPQHGRDDDEQRILSEIETAFLDVFGDAYCNKHLMYGILELFLVRLMPELAEKSVKELWEERLGAGSFAGFTWRR